MVSAARHYKSELLVEISEAREAYLETAEQTQIFVEVPSSAIHPVNMTSEHKNRYCDQKQLHFGNHRAGICPILRTLLGVIGNAQ
mgnify:CR=1 FL=1